jgi:hypothetical protein
VRIVRPKSVPFGRNRRSMLALEPGFKRFIQCHRFQAVVAAAVSVVVPTIMRLGDRDNLVRIAHALFYVALLLALLWMFSCRWHASYRVDDVGAELLLRSAGTH